MDTNIGKLIIAVNKLKLMTNVHSVLMAKYIEWINVEWDVNNLFRFKDKLLALNDNISDKEIDFAREACAILKMSLSSIKNECINDKDDLSVKTLNQFIECTDEIFSRIGTLMKELSSKEITLDTMNKFIESFLEKIEVLNKELSEFDSVLVMDVDWFLKEAKETNIKLDKLNTKEWHDFFVSTKLMDDYLEECNDELLKRRTPLKIKSKVDELIVLRNKLEKMIDKNCQFTGMG